MTGSDSSDGKWQKIRWANEAEADPKTKKLGANLIYVEEIWEFTALSNMISLYFQNYHLAINVGNELEQRETRGRKKS